MTILPKSYEHLASSPPNSMDVLCDFFHITSNSRILLGFHFSDFLCHDLQCVLHYFSYPIIRTSFSQSFGYILTMPYHHTKVPSTWHRPSETYNISFHALCQLSVQGLTPIPLLPGTFFWILGPRLPCLLMSEPFILKHLMITCP